jgi:hypothetical protein
MSMAVLHGRIQESWGRTPPIFQKRSKNIYNFVKKLKIYISNPIIFFSL